jgi:hypothetical protein
MRVGVGEIKRGSGGQEKRVEKEKEKEKRGEKKGRRSEG